MKCPSPANDTAPGPILHLTPVSDGIALAERSRESSCDAS